jgi:hypothetical protein
MSHPRFEAFLAELYTDAEARQRFLSDPKNAARLAGLDERDVEALASIDRIGLELAARSFECKRAARRPRQSRWLRWLARRRSDRTGLAS